MTPAQITMALHTLVNVKQPVFIWGAPGVGKSRVVNQVASNSGMALRDIRAVLLDPVDLRGLPRIAADNSAVWCPPGFLPSEKDEERGIIFLDELNAAPPLVQAACYQLVLDRRIGEYRLPDGWTVIAAGNREKDRAVTHRMPSALANRMVHLDFETDLDDWIRWAQEAEICPEIIAFLRFRPKLLHDFNPAAETKAFASPRSWEFLSNILKAKPQPEIEYQLFQGTVGTSAAAEFAGFLKIWRELPEIELIMAKPEEAPVPADPAVTYALCEALARKAGPETMPALVAYAARLEPEFSVLLMRDAVCHNSGIVGTEAFAGWAEANAHVLM